MTQVIYNRHSWWLVGDPDIFGILVMIEMEADTGRQTAVAISNWISGIETQPGFKNFSIESTGNTNSFGNKEWFLIANFDTTDNALMAKLVT